MYSVYGYEYINVEMTRAVTSFKRFEEKRVKCINVIFPTLIEVI